MTPAERMEYFERANLRCAVLILRNAENGPGSVVHQWACLVIERARERARNKPGNVLARRAEAERRLRP